MKKNIKNRNIYKILMNNKRVNNYTKLLLYLSTLDYYEDYYIPNKKLSNKINTSYKNVRLLLHQLEKDNVIGIFYKGRKRYFIFTLLNEKSEEEIKEAIEKPSNVFDYNWLEDGEW